MSFATEFRIAIVAHPALLFPSAAYVMSHFFVDTPPFFSQKREERAHVFNDCEALEQVTQAIIERGEQTGIDDEQDDYERYGLFFSEAIGFIIRIQGNQTPLYYGEIKIVKSTIEYHVIPRTGLRRTS